MFILTVRDLYWANLLSNHLSDSRDLEIPCIAPDIVGLGAPGFRRKCSLAVGTGGISNMDEWAPVRPIAIDGKCTVGKRPEDKVVHHKIESDPRGIAVHG
jgi:hypothetical protein